MKPMGKDTSRKIRVIGIIFAIFTFIVFLSSIPIPEMLYAYISKGYTTGEITGEIKILNIITGTPAYSAGLQTGDIIKKVNGSNIGSTEDYLSIISGNIGKTIEIEVLRDGKVLQVRLVPRQNYPQGQGPTGIEIANETKNNDQRAVERLSMALAKSYLGYESISKSPLGTFALVTTVTKGYVHYEYTGNFKYTYVALYTILLFITSFGVLKRKKWSVYLVVVNGIFIFGSLIYLLFMQISNKSQFSLNGQSYLILALEIGLDLLFIYFSYYLYKNKEQFS